MRDQLPYVEIKDRIPHGAFVKYNQVRLELAEGEMNPDYVRKLAALRGIAYESPLDDGPYIVAIAWDSGHSTREYHGHLEIIKWGD